MKKRFIIPFLFLGLLATSCSNPNSSLEQIKYDTKTPEDVITNITDDLKKEINLQVNCKYEKVDYLENSTIVDSKTGYILILKDSKYQVISLLNNRIIFESDSEPILDSVQTNDLGILYLSNELNGETTYYLYDSFGTEIFNSKEDFGSYEFTFISKMYQKYQFKFTAYLSDGVVNKYFIYSFDNTISVEKSDVLVSYNDIKYNTETTVGEVSRYGYYPLREYGNDGYYTVADGYFAYFNKDYEYKRNFKTLFDDYFILGKYVISYEVRDVDYLRDDYDYLSSKEKKVQNYVIYDITSGKKVNGNLDNIALGTVDEDTIGYDKRSDLYYFNCKVIENRVLSSKFSLVTIDDFDIESVEYLDYEIDSYLKDANDNIYYDRNNKIEFFDENLTKTLSLDYTDKIDNSYFIVKNNNKYGMVNKDGKTILPAEYSNIITNFNGAYFDTNILAVKNSIYYSVNYKTGAIKELKGFVYNTTYGIGYIKVQEEDSNNNIIKKLQIYCGGNLIDELVTNGTNPSFTFYANSDDLLVSASYKDTDGNSQIAMYRKSITITQY